MKVVKHIARVLVGITFIFSGFVKGIDPWGSAYKFTDYFHAMGMDWLVWSAFPLGVLLSFAEFAIGVALLFNVFLRFFSWLALLFMVFFTGLTLWIAIENPVTDCGCFGDALVISNWETFYKNVVLIILAIIVFFYRKKMKPLNKKVSFVLSLTTVVVYFGIVIYSYNHLPIFDFRPYKVGVNIPESMSFPDDAPKDVYENIFYYRNKNTGEVERFTEDNYPWQDTLNWEFDNMESILIQEGYVPPIHDFTIVTPDGEDIKDFFIYDENFVFMLVAYNLDETSVKEQDKINALANWARENEMQFICLTASLPDKSAEFAQKHDTPYEYFNTDEITLKTMIRSNPGLIVLKDGDVIEKYHYNDIPTPEEFQENVMNK